MNPGRSIGHGGDRGGIDGNEKSRGSPQAASCPINITQIPKGNRICMADSSDTTVVEIIWSILIVKAAVACSCQEDLE